MRRDGILVIRLLAGEVCGGQVGLIKHPVMTTIMMMQSWLHASVWLRGAPVQWESPTEASVRLSHQTLIGSDHQSGFTLTGNGKPLSLFV